MFGKLDVRRKSIVTLALSSDNRKIVVRQSVNRIPDDLPFLKTYSGHQRTMATAQRPAVDQSRHGCRRLPMQLAARERVNLLPSTAAC